MVRKSLIGSLCLLLITSSAFATDWAAELGEDPLAASVRLARLEKGAVPLLTGLLSHESAAVRRGAALTAGRIGAAAAPLFPHLLVRLNEPAPAVRAAAAWAIARLGQQVPPPELYRALADESPVVRRAAAGAIETIGNVDPDRLEALAAGENLPAAEMARRIVASLAQDRTGLADGIATAPDDLIEMLLRDAADYLIEIEPSVVSSFLHHENGNLRLAAIRALVRGCEDDRQEADVLAKALRHSDPAVREEVAGMVTETDEAAAVLLAALEDPAPEVRSLAVRSLQFTDETFPALLRALTDPSPAVRKAAIRQFDEMDPIEPLIECLGDRNPEVAAAAAVQVGWRGETAIPGLVEVLKRRGDQRLQFALRALSGMYGKAKSAIPAIAPHLDAEDPVTRLEAANAMLANLGESMRAVEIMREALCSQDPSRRLSACRLIATFSWGSVTPWEEERRRRLPIARELLRLKRSDPGPIGELADRAARERGFHGFPEIEQAEEAANCLRCLGEERGRRKLGHVRGGVGTDLRIGAWSVHGTGWITPWACVRQLGGAPEHLEILGWAADSGDPVLADWADVSLRREGHIEGPPPDALAARLTSSDPYVRWRAIKDLSAAGAKSRSVAGQLGTMSKDPSRWVRIAAAAALRAIRGK